jgi:hypothetical protein
MLFKEVMLLSSVLHFIWASENFHFHRKKIRFFRS